MVRQTLKLSLVATCVSAAFAAQAATLSGQSDALARLSAQAGAAPLVTVEPATGGVRMLRLDASAGRRAVLARGAATDDAKHAASTQFLGQYAELFGIKDVGGELSKARVEKDRQGGTHITYKQFHNGVPVFGGEIKTHFDASGNLTVVNGSFVPGLSVSTVPGRSADEAARAAVALSKGELASKLPASSLSRITAGTPVLTVYREGLLQGVEGSNRLVWQVEVGNRGDARDTYFLDAVSLKVVDKFSGIHDAKNRRAFDGAGSTTEPGPNYPANPLWVEGQPFPTGNTEADNMIAASSEIYDLFKNAFGRDSFDGAGARMDSIFNRGWGCVNASWNGTYISFCPGTTTDDVTAHEWGHAYTQYTHGLIYAWQPGALNEAYSDIWGETVDRINGRGGDTPDTARTPGVCAAITAPAQYVNVTAPSGLAGVKSAGTAAWGPQTFNLSGTIVGVGVGTTNAACAALPAGSLTGKIAFIDRGTCGFSVKALNAQNAGAAGVIIGNNQGGTTVLTMGLTQGSTPTIPSLSVSQNDGTAIKNALATGDVNAAIVRVGAPTYNTVRWLMGEDSTAFGGAIRDMYNPTCYGNPGKVSDSQYSCGPNTQAGDWGGVHTNSGVPNHAYALLVDGGTFNGQPVSAIGLTKAAHIYWRAQSVYQGPTSGFAAHADALEQSCRDLTGATLADLKTGGASGEVITASDCAQVTNAMVAVEMRATPSQCNFAPILAKNPPALCPSGTQSTIASDGFDGGRKAGIKWAVTHAGPANYAAKDWGVTNALPTGRTGYAMYAADRNIGTCAAGGIATSLQTLESAAITIPADATTLRMAFDHYVSTESGYDGGNVKISVNGGAWQIVAAADFVYNPYNTTLVAASGSTNPLAGQAAFSGTDAGSLSGSWGRSIINLAPYAKSGDTIKLRFEMGTDDCGGTGSGWYVDDVQVYRCVAAP